MRSEFKKEPREFEVGQEHKIILKDYGKVYLEEDEMISFKTASGKEYDFTAKDWGFYASPSLNGRLKREGFKSAIVKNQFGMHHLMAIEGEKMDAFEKYLTDHKMEVVEWMDTK